MNTTAQYTLSPVISEERAAEMIGISTVTLRRKRKQGTGPRHIRRTDRLIGYWVSDVLAWLEERAVGGPAA